MANISDAAPEFAAEVVAALRGVGRPSLASQLIVAEIAQTTYDAGASAGYVYLCAPAAVVAGVHREATPVAETLPFAAPHWFNVDVDHEGYAFGVELLGRPDVIEKIRSAAAV